MQPPEDNETLVVPLDKRILEIRRYPEYFGTTPGEFVFMDKIVGYSIELPWRDNAKGRSCIPAGEYGLIVNQSARFKKLLPLVQDVPGRSGIRIHGANKVTELEGCIAPAMSIVVARRQVVGQMSQAQLKDIMMIIEHFKINKIKFINA